MVSTTTNPPQPRREPPRPPLPAIVEAEQQWLFTEDELLLAPSIVDGMAPEEERTLRRKGVNFILQVGMMLKLPQTTMSTAAVFFNRYLMMNSLKPKPGFKPLHHYQVAATGLFLATKVEENCRKMKELVVACVRVALKDPNKLVDEQTKDFWKWRDTILYSEDVLLESLCFDLNVESPYKVMYDMLKYYGIEHNKKLRNSAWAFLSDSASTQMCLLFTSRTIAAASIYAGARMADVDIPADDGKPWWEIQHVKLRDIRKACNLMADLYEKSPDKEGEPNMYAGLRTPEEGIDFGDTPQSMEGVQLTNPESTQQQQPANGADSGGQTERGSEEGELDG
ncbi:cyclin-like protein [Dothidotthia symphoricarpi CBS 119687]|uniref:RNA polymerase II holoenzyme cyclin-like subunit n=1 Tax=Dothidotthia symphoricarpi CBS 119687 TaxID=1392245 RepID=A0A6A6AN94_9PLEO|nr:cyclin-like protein [Dothidotthia symphoricarpi CBS 119687]KAF2133399.1 cyclin-like protein [Dothidotthia symphoricarpi CBS 119687]